MDSHETPQDSQEQSSLSGNSLHSVDSRIEKSVEKHFHQMFERLEFQLVKRLEEKIKEQKKNSQTSHEEQASKILADILQTLKNEKTNHFQEVKKELKQTIKEALVSQTPEEEVDDAASAKEPSFSSEEAYEEAVIEGEEIDENLAEDIYEPDVLPEIINASAYDRANRIYQALCKQSFIIHEGILKNTKIQLDSLKSLLSEAIDLILNRDREFVKIALQPYPDKRNYLVYHHVHATFLTLVLGVDLRLRKKELQELALTAFLHDISQIKDKEKLHLPSITKSLSKELRKHPTHSCQMLTAGVNERILKSIEAHHESWDGSGYPKGLKGGQIPLYAQILYLVDRFEALCHRRPYRKTPLLTHDAASKILSDQSSYNPLVKKSFLNRVGIYPIGSFVQLSNRETCEVILQNSNHPTRPIVMIESLGLEGEDERRMVIDLSKNPLLSISGLSPSAPEPVDVGEMSRVVTKRRRRKEREYVHYQNTKVKMVMPFVLTLAFIIVTIIIVLQI